MLCRVLPLLLCGAITCLTLYRCPHISVVSVEPQPSVAPPKSMLDGCDRVYVDVGTNIGVQIRKLYEVSAHLRLALCPAGI